MAGPKGSKDCCVLKVVEDGVSEAGWAQREVSWDASLTFLSQRGLYKTDQKRYRGAGSGWGSETTLFEASGVEIKMDLNKLCSNLGVTVDGVCCCMKERKM